MNRRAHAGRTRSGGLSLNVFTDDEFKDVHLATLEVLEQTGVFTDDPEALGVFEAGGATVDRESGIVKIPARRRGGGHRVSPGASLRRRPGPQQRRHARPRPCRLHHVRRGTEGRRPRDRRAAGVHQAGRRRHGAAGRLPRRARHLRVGSRGSRRAARDGDHPQLRGGRLQHHQARLRRPPLTMGDGGDPRHRGRRRGRA